MTPEPPSGVVPPSFRTPTSAAPPFNRSQPPFTPRSASLFQKRSKTSPPFPEMNTLTLFCTLSVRNAHPGPGGKVESKGRVEVFSSAAYVERPASTSSLSPPMQKRSDRCIPTAAGREKRSCGARGARSRPPFGRHLWLRQPRKS